MLKETAPCVSGLSKKEIKQQLKTLGLRLSELQHEIKRNKLPVLVLVEGWGASGKGSRIGRIIDDIDPRFFNVVPAEPLTREELRRPFLWRHFEKIPEAGKFLFLDSGWMDQTVSSQLRREFTKEEYHTRLQEINAFERQLCDNGYCLVKVFLHISREEQEKRLSKLLDNPDTSWRVSENDRWQNKHYEACFAAFDDYLDQTNPDYAPWHVISADSGKEADLCFFKTVIAAVEQALASQNQTRPIVEKEFPLAKTPLLCDVKLDKSVSDEEYKEELKTAQKKLKNLHNTLYRRKIPVMIAYEGWDAAGKGGNIKRLAQSLDPRGFEVHPIAAPEPHEASRHYLWRFNTRLPKSGHIAIFDRTWYGRVLVERVEGFAADAEWRRAYTEINEFERVLSNWGAVILKFWIQIDKETQLNRFTDRQNNPDKQWKITDEDWRNREKWDLYETAVNDMLQKTGTVYAPWHIIESTDKKYARLKTLHLTIAAVEKALAENK